MLTSSTGKAVVLVLVVTIARFALAESVTFDFESYSQYGVPDESCLVDPSPPLFNRPEYGAETADYIVDPAGCGEGAYGVSFGSDSLLTAMVNSTNSNTIRFSWEDPTDHRSWLRLPAYSVPEQAVLNPSPTVDLRPGSSIEMKIAIYAFDAAGAENAAGQLEVALILRETGLDLPLGTDGGTSGDLEFVGIQTKGYGTPPNDDANTPIGGTTITHSGTLTWSTVKWTLVKDEVEDYVSYVDVSVDGGAPVRKYVVDLTGEGFLWALFRRGTLDSLAIRKPESDSTSKQWFVWIDDIVIEINITGEACCAPDGSCVELTAADCVANGGVPQGPGSDCTVASCTPMEDCNKNGIPDQCDLACGAAGGFCDVSGCGESTDYNGNGEPDDCESDCNGNGVPDAWDISEGTSQDCNGNGIPDECDIGREIVGWGNISHGLPSIPLGIDFVAISGGGYHNLALRRDGSVVAWGENGSGQTDVPAGLDDVMAIAAGGDHSLALRQDGSLVAWGDNSSGQTTVPSGNDFMAIAAGGWHSLAVQADGTIESWGMNNYNQLDVPAGYDDFVAVAAGNFHSLALRANGSIIGWGWDYNGQATPPAGNDFVAIAAGANHSLALHADGSILSWGWESYGLVADTPSTGVFVAIDGGWKHSVALRADGSIVAWGADIDGQTDPPAGYAFTSVAAGWYHNIAMRRPDGVGASEDINTNGTPDECDPDCNGNGLPDDWDISTETSPDCNMNGVPDECDTDPGREVVQWGDSSLGQGSAPAGVEPVALAGGAYHTVSLLSDGSIACWGDDSEGQVSEAPVTDGFVAVAADGHHSLALHSDGTISVWGDDTFDQITDVPTDSDFIAIAAGGGHCLALHSDTSIVGWGDYNNDGQADPPPGANTDFAAIAAGSMHSLALRNDGSLVGWGNNDWGQCNVPSGDDFVAIAAGAYHSLALRDDGSIVGWGRDNFGQATPTLPGEVPNADFVAIAGGAYHSLALRDDGLLVGWGMNGQGQVTVPSGTDYCAIGARWFHSLALRPPAGRSADVNEDRIPDECQTDSDGDGVVDALDQCPDTAPGTSVDEVGCPLVSPGDFDGDGDVDLTDFGAFAACFNGPNRAPAPACTVSADIDLDGDVDLTDFGVFASCFNGPNRPPASSCP